MSWKRMTALVFVLTTITYSVAQPEDETWIWEGEWQDSIISTSKEVVPDCRDLSEIDFGLCERILGWGIVDGECAKVTGCPHSGVGFFASLEDCLKECSCTDSEWPNPCSSANSDRWLRNHHANIEVLRPQVLVLHFVNSRTMGEMWDLINDLLAAFDESTRYHGHSDPSAIPMVQYEIFKAVDLRDVSVPPGYQYNNSTLFPREDPVDGHYSFDYEQLFSEEFAAYYNVPDEKKGYMDLCELINAGYVHEVWVYHDANPIYNDVGLAEILELKPLYNEDRMRISDWHPMDMGPCAGNGCFDEEDVEDFPAHCARTIRIASLNHNRGPGCFVHSLDHGFERTGLRNYIPYFTDYFKEFAGFDLNSKYGTPFSSWYICPYSGPDCITFTGPRSLDYHFVRGSQTYSGTIENYLPACGNVHFPPNGERHYDVDNWDWVDSTCEHFRMFDGPGGHDIAVPYNKTKLDPYMGLGWDCGGQWDIWWRQNVPGFDNPSIDKHELPMLSWWPFVYY